MAKQEIVAQMFNKIADRYDFLNHLLSFGMDFIWRRKMIKMLIKHEPGSLLDVATGTGDLMILAKKKHDFKKVTGLDISEGMLAYAKEKVSKTYTIQSENVFDFIQGPAESMPLNDNSYDRICVGFGVRNFEDLSKGLSEMHRVLVPGGSAYILEFSKPRSIIFAPLYQFYFKNILPIIGRLVSKDKEAYTYLFKTVQEFPDYEDFATIMAKSGFINISYKPLSLGICTIYTGSK
jgi:demethylmenaquinone methyltransferase/2-methoxy-6-polyprenyl-1,4-benzoquinol methylase